MKINDALIDKLAHLSRLSFNEQEKNELRSGLEKMIALVHKMDELNTDDVEPLLHINDNKNVFRADVVQGSVSTADALRNAAIHDGSFFKVPTVIKK